MSQQVSNITVSKDSKAFEGVITIFYSWLEAMGITNVLEVEPSDLPGELFKYRCMGMTTWNHIDWDEFRNDII